MFAQVLPLLLRKCSTLLRCAAISLLTILVAVDARGEDPPPRFNTATIKRGDFISTITALGTVEPEAVVDVAAQVPGRITAFGIDPADNGKKKQVDFGTAVRAGTILAYLEDTNYRTQVDQAEATIRRGAAVLKQLHARHELARLELKQAENQPPGSGADKAAGTLSVELAKARLSEAEANISIGEAAMEQSKAALKLAQVNLENTVIKSPIDGVVIDRRVNVGQAVAPHVDAGGLFLIASDLSKLQVWVAVDEINISRIRVGMPVRFSVDAFPGDQFLGTVSQVRLNAAFRQGAVSYTVIVAVDNSKKKLIPYLTAQVHFDTQHANVLMAPNVALRFKPRRQQVAPDAQPNELLRDQPNVSQLWVRDGNFLKPVKVEIGETNGMVTEVIGDGVKEGMEIITGVKLNLNDGARKSESGKRGDTPRRDNAT